MNHELANLAMHDAGVRGLRIMGHMPEFQEEQGVTPCVGIEN
jgi:hypothetical protein